MLISDVFHPPADRAREIYQMGFEFYGQDEEGIDKSQSLYSAFAKMEVRHKEYDRARVIYKVRWTGDSASRFRIWDNRTKSGDSMAFCSSPSNACLALGHLSSMRRTRTLRSSLATGPASKSPSSGSAASSTRRS